MKLSKKDTLRFWSKVVFTEGCWLWMAAKDKLGYGFFSLARRSVRPYRVSLALSGASLKKGLVVDHLCRNPQCVNPAHLEQVTVKENTRRGLSVGNTWSRGSKNGQAKLTPNQVIAARKDYTSSDISYKALAARYGVSVSVIGDAVSGSSWSHVSKIAPEAFEIAKKRAIRRASAARAAFNEADIPMLCELYEAGLMQREIGDLFGVSQCCISFWLRRAA